MDDIDDRSLAEIASLLRERKVTARELAEQALERSRFGAYLHVDRERTLRHAEGADRAFEAGYDVGPLQGVPVSVKDLFGVPGYPTFAGSPRRLPERFEQPGPVVRALLDQLGVVTGKTHTVEFAFGGIGTNPHHPTPRNPWDASHHRAPGGSSAGAGVSLAEGSAFVALGTDTAGSVRIPAAWTGTVALKTTKGRWSTEGIVPLSTTLDTAGVLARTVGDAIDAFRALDPRGPIDIPDVEASAVRIGVCRTMAFDGCGPGVAEAVEEAVRELASHGARVTDTEMPEVEPARALFELGGPVSVELHVFLESELPEWPATLDPNVRARVGDAAQMPAREYLRRKTEMSRLAVAADARFETFDVLVMPTVANGPPRLDDIAEGDAYRRENLLALRNTAVVSYLGLCAMTIPVGRDAEGMPVGMQLVAPAFEERRLLAIARAFERVLGTCRDRIGRAPVAGRASSGTG